MGWEDASKELQPQLCSSNCLSHHCLTMTLCSSVILNLPCVIWRGAKVRSSELWLPAGCLLHWLYSPGPWQGGLWVLCEHCAVCLPCCWHVWPFCSRWEPKGALTWYFLFRLLARRMVICLVCSVSYEGYFLEVMCSEVAEGNAVSWKRWRKQTT